jgi:hypothetical protein
MHTYYVLVTELGAFTCLVTKNFINKYFAGVAFPTSSRKENGGVSGSQLMILKATHLVSSS